MASNWIKMRSDLHSHPKVVRIVSALNADACPHGVQLSSEKFRVIGGLHAVWSLFDAHSEDGTLVGYTPETLDAVLGFAGLSHAMAAVDWLVITPQALVLPEFDTHNGQSAKRRAQEADRKRDVRNASASNADKKRTRIEKNRDTPIAPKGASAGKKISLADYLAQCEVDRVDPIPDSDAVWKYPETMGLPADWIPLAWWAFQGRYLAKPGEKVTKYLSWPQAFRNAVRENWLRLWWLKEGAYELTTAGQQALREMRTDR